MSFFRAEPEIAAGLAERTGVLLCNLGTPDAPTPAAVRRYLAEFLGDPRVVELPRALWLPILHGLILRTRPAQSATKYRAIWQPEGSPLLLWSRQQAALLRGYLGERGHDIEVRLAMRYGTPSVAGALDELKATGCTRVLVVPLYPQYSGSTTASVIDAVARWAQRTRHVPELRFINRFHDDDGYIGALASRVRDHWRAHGKPERLLISFHGVPQAMAKRGDPYVDECRATASMLAARLALREGEWSLAFQSRFGRAKWVGPATQATVEALARSGVRRVDVVCPGFVSDCLETLEEIGIEVRAAFKGAGGDELGLVPCLNDHPDWIRALSQLVERHLQGWPTSRSANRG